MITLRILCLLGFGIQSSASGEWTEEDRRWEAQQVAMWEEKLEIVKNSSAEEQLSELWLGLRNMGFRSNLHEGHSHAVESIYLRIQAQMMSIPGHARYFADEIKKEQKAVESYPTGNGPRLEYDRIRSLYFQVFQNLPSPETIAVLGEFLYDDKDTPLTKIAPGSDWGPNPLANSFVSVGALARIGLRDPPVTPDRAIVEVEDVLLAETRAWWEEIRAGKKRFSFLGDNVEYRFKPDGTWETLALANPPDDARFPAEQRDPAATSPVKLPPPAALAPDEKPWKWLVVAGAALLAIGVRLRWRRVPA